MPDYYYSDISEMNFKVSKKQQEFLGGIDAACREIRPYEDEAYLAERLNDKVVPVFGRIGMLGCPISKRYGGLGLDMLTYALAIERIGQEGSSLRTFFSAHISIGQLVLQGWGNEEQKKEYLPDTATGKKVMAFALTEPAAGSDPAAMTTTFEETPEGFLLKGKKHWIGNGTFAGVMTTYAKDPSTGRVSAFIVDGDAKGLRVEEMKNKMGLFTVKNAEIYFDRCTVPKKNLLGRKGRGLSIAYSALIDGRLSVAAGAVGVMEDCLAEAVAYAKSRHQHGGPLAKKQLVQEHIARIAVDIESSRWLVYRAAAARQKLHEYVEGLKENEKWLGRLGRQNREYAALRWEADRLAAIAKFHASNRSFECANRSVQVFGSAGYRKTARVARHFLDSRATIIYEGANEVLELKIASGVLGDEYAAY
ncbi:acyl-CoA dehydrogenase family protein [Nitrososphaera viennensis]|uniref:Acyl-CoA dehydrogenase family protein n=1 Tax=Nitrososphaera viennensis TaxID=1034015 RepID=A0A977IEN6_9ARCH|nr:acyl-CoA dehydrogenase family protein [Nitrososphaera viennensis]UVS69372.1 acyl-CoA dehydrogenase family protein [Nitrososphaera viennensis]